MKVALTIWDGWISPVFDVCREAVALQIEAGQITARGRVGLAAASPMRKIQDLLDVGVETLICGAISEEVRRDAEARGLEVIGFVAGETDVVLQAFLSDGLPTPALSMPGCRGQQIRRRRGRGGAGRAARGRGRGQGRKRR